MVAITLFLAVLCALSWTGSCSCEASEYGMNATGSESAPVKVLLMVTAEVGSAEDEGEWDPDAGEDVVRAAELAVSHVNAGCNLNGQRLQLLKESFQCDRQQALDVFHSYLFNSTRMVAIIGTGCSLASEAVAEVSQYYNLSLISYASSSIALNRRDRFPYYLRTVPSDSLIAEGMSAFIRHFNWTRASLITQNTKAFSLLSEELAERLEMEAGVGVMANVLVPQNLSKLSATDLFPADVRIIALSVDSEVARHIICEAFHRLNWRQYRYVWLTQGWYEDRWWEGQLGSEVNCSNSELLEFLYKQRVLVFSHYPTSFDQAGISGIMPSDFEMEFVGFPPSKTSWFAYDAVWALTQGLNALAGTISYATFDPFDVGNQDNRQRGEAIRNSLDNVSFRGLSGHVQLQDGSRVLETVQILQYTNNSNNLQGIPAMVGVVQLLNDMVVLLEDIWPEELGPPRDGTPYVTENYPLLWLVITSYVFAALTIVAALICLLLNFIFRNRKLIRLSSPNLNSIIGVGAIVFCISVFFFAYPPLNHDILNAYCGIRSWFAAIGYTLCFGTINTKMWRVYYIFHNPKPAARKKPLKDWHLFLFVMIFLAVDLVILVICTSLDNVRLEVELVPDREHPSELDDEGIMVSYEVVLCESRWKNLWLGVLLGYKVINQAIGVFLAFKIRKVKIKVLNDSKEIVATLYLSSLILATVIIITLAFGNYLNVYAAGYAYGIPLSAIVVLGVVFVSKYIRLYRDPTGNKLFTHATQQDTAMASVAIATYDENQIHTLQRKIKNLEARLQTNAEPCNVVVNGDVMNGDDRGGDVDKEDGSGGLRASNKSNSNGSSKHVQIVLANSDTS